MKRRDVVFKRKLKNYDVKSFTQTKIDERSLAKNLRIPSLLKSEVGGSKNMKAVNSLKMLLLMKRNYIVFWGFLSLIAMSVKH